jgi:uncharacterized membrane protein
MIVSIIIFGTFYYSLLFYSDSLIDRKELEIVLYWLYFLLLISLSAVLFFSLMQFISNWRDNPKSIIRPLIWTVVLGTLLGGTFLLGSGMPLKMDGYEGVENSYYWLKMIDMWIYTLYILLGINILVVFIGILWSYFKKTR